METERDSRRAIYDAIPHREPFLMVDEIIERSLGRIVCGKTFSGREEFFAGHYPGFPVLPGVLLCEAAMQAGAILLAEHIAAAGGKEGVSGRMPVVTRMNDVRFKRLVRPGETIRIEVELVERLAEAFFLKAKASVAGQLAARLEFACTLVAGEGV
jgi:3-hydroxyacyl-[acyl-carrier-protein] dehydratase